METNKKYPERKPPEKDEFKVKKIYTNRKRSYYKEGSFVENKLYIKMNIMEEGKNTLTFLNLFKNIGEVKLYEYFAVKCFDTKDNYHLHDKKSVIEVKSKLGIAPSTQIKYLKNLVDSTLLLKQEGHRGYYTLNPLFADVTRK